MSSKNGNLNANSFALLGSSSKFI